MVRTNPAKVVSSKVVRTNPAKVASSRAGRINPVNKAVSNVDLKSKARRLNAGPFLIASLLQLSGSFCLLIDHAFGDLR